MKSLDPSAKETLIQHIKQHEGFSATLYKDTVGKWTIGYGQMVQDGISKGVAEAMLRVSLEEMEELLLERMRQEGHEPLDTHPPKVVLALFNMLYNLGPFRLLGFKRMWAALDQKDYGAAADEALDSKWARQVGLRANELANMIRGA